MIGRYPTGSDAYERHTAIIVGAGVTGVGVSYHLARRGIEHIILERADTLGGIWRTERWPGVRCDTEMVSYSFSFAPMITDRPLLTGDTIARYLERTARETGIAHRIRFSTAVSRAIFDDATCQWILDTDRGRFAARFLINANGYFADAPHIPAFAGADRFAGEFVHLSHLTETSQIKGKRVILVGSGASAISAAPAIAAQAASVTIVQRSPSYIFEDRNRLGRATRLASLLYDAGVCWPVAAVRFCNRAKNDFIFVLFRACPHLGRWFFRRHWRRHVGEAAPEGSFTPRYDPWHQRIPVAVGLKACVDAGTVRFVTGAIEKITATGVRLTNGRRVDGDLCVLATGYDLDLFKFALFRGNEKIDVTRTNFFKGMMLGGVPNYFQPLGVLHATWTQRVERVARLFVQIMGHMERHRYDTVMVERRDVPRQPRITPNYIMRNLQSLPAIHGTLEIPTLDNWLCFAFRAKDYVFARGKAPTDTET